MNYFPNQIVRNRPLKDGVFKVYRVKGHVLDMIEVQEIDRETGEELRQEPEFLHPDKVQLYRIISPVETISINDMVQCKGLKGQHKIQGFFESKDNLMVIVTDKNNLVRPLPVEYVKKAIK